MLCPDYHCYEMSSSERFQHTMETQKKVTIKGYYKMPLENSYSYETNACKSA